MGLKFLERSRALEREGGRSSAHLEVGGPDFKTPAGISEAGARAIRKGKTPCSRSRDLVELREDRCEDSREGPVLPAA